ncbi:MAG TPA: hypothetical protein V6C69_13600 [Trichormus sp.]|jgi:hypothetical protein
MNKRATEKRCLHWLLAVAAVCLTFAAVPTAANSAPTSANSAPAAPSTVTTMAMEGGCTFVFQLPSGYKLRERATPMPGCDSMVWMAPNAAAESDGVIFQLGVLKPTVDMLKAMQDVNLTQVAKSILNGKAEGWKEFHPTEPSEVTIANVKYIRIDFDGVRKDGGTKITGFQMVGEYKEKLVSIVVEAPEKSQSELDSFNRLAKTIQVQ